MTTLLVNGNTYTDDDDPLTGMGRGGYRDRLLPMLSDTMTDVGGKKDAAAASVTAAAASAAAAAGSAATAASAPGTSATSASAASIGTGVVNIVIQANKAIVPGMSVKMAVTAAASNWNHGDVQAYNSATGALTINVTRTQTDPVNPVANSSAWTVSLSSPSYQNGAVGGAYYNNSITADIVLAANSPRLQALAAIRPGVSVILPDATTLPPGPGQFELRSMAGYASDYEFDIAIKDKAGNLLGFLSPSASVTLGLIDNTSASGIWHIPGLLPIGSPALGKVSLASVVNGSGGTWTKVVQLDVTRALLLIYGVSLHAVIFDASTGTFGTPVLLRATLSTTGVDATVAGLLIGTNQVLVTSAQDGTTALQTVVLSISGSAITPGTVVSTTLAATLTRIVDFVTVGSTYVLAYAVSTTALRTLVITVSGTTPTVGAEIAATTTGVMAILPMTATLFIALISSGTTAIVARPVTISGTTQSLGTTASLACTTLDSFAVRLVSTGRWMAAVINGTAKAAIVSVSGTVAAWTAQVAMSTITNINVGGMVTNSGPGTPAITVATSGLDGSGRFVTEFAHIYDNAGTPTSAGSFILRAFAAAQTVVALSDVSTLSYWLVTSAKEALVLRFSSVVSFILNSEYRIGAIAANAQAMPSADPLYPKVNLARNALAGSSYIGLGDGSKESLRIQPGSYLTVMDRPFQAVNNMSYCAKGADDSEAWVAFSQAPETAVYLQKVKVA
ncbi:hypothetical protein AB4Z19_19040 [Pseudoduganella sp. RAF19]|uniref:hypothetical protein n=1 Tax=Pseudoduganella sp. RAF19 TaxID=3233052 RepID=UPI003F9B44CF